MSELPFEITTRLIDARGTVSFTAEIDGEQITSEQYKPGQGDKRRKVAKCWAGDDRLHNGKLLTSITIARALEAKELEAQRELDAMPDEGQEDSDSEIVEAASYVDDDTLAELVWNILEGHPDFVAYDRESHQVTRKPTLETAIGKIGPPSCWSGVVTPGGNIPGTVFVPTEWNETGTDEDRLRESVAAFIKRYVGLPGDTAYLCIEYVLLTWLHDNFDELPYLAFRTADAGRGKSRALETVGAICYRPILCGGGSTPAATLRLLDLFGGTLVADEYDQSANTEQAGELTKIINQGFQKNRPLVRCDGEKNAPRAFRCFGPKVFALRKRFPDDATETRIVSIHMREPRPAWVPITLPRAQFDREALSLRNQLLAWRFANHGKITIDAAHADPRLEDRANQIGLSLMAVAGTVEGRERVVAILMEQQRTIAEDRADTLPGLVLATILRIGAIGGTVRPKDVANAINTQRAKDAGIEGVDRLQKDQRLRPEKVAWILRTILELPRDRDNVGAFYKLEAARMEELSFRFGAPLPQPTQPTHLHPTPKPTPEIGLFDPKNRDYVGSVGCVGCTDGPNDSNDQPTLDQHSDQEPDDSGAGSGADAMWAEQATMPPAVLRDRASRTDDPETKQRLLALARGAPVTIPAGADDDENDRIPF